MLRTRYLRIVFFFGRVVAGVIGWDLVLPRLGLRRLAERTRSARATRWARQFRALAIRMGGVLIKVGQFLSARVDVLPEAVTVELSGLQDEVPPEDFEAVRQLLESELGARIEERFTAFQSVPLAAASLGQVHRAALPGGEAVVVKVQRPGIDRLIRTDLSALRTVGGWLRRYPPIRRRLDVDALLAEFTRVLHEEMDYLAEGRNAETFQANFAADPGVRVPAVHWSHTTARVLTLEDVYAIKITDYAAIAAAGIDRAEVADRLFHTYLKQIFEDGWFHADPHPGNLFVEPASPPTPFAPSPLSQAEGHRLGEGGGGGGERGEGEWRLVFVDYGMVGRVPPGAKAQLREAVIAVGTQDAARLVRAYQGLGVVLPTADLSLLERAEAAMFARFWGKTMAELRDMPMDEMRAFAHEFRQLLYEMPFQVPVDLVYLGRTVAILSGMCTGLNPDFNVWTGLAPYAQKLITEAAGDGGWGFWLGELADVLRSLVALPRRTEQLIGRLERGEITLRTSASPDLARQLDRLTGAVQQLVGGVIFAALLAVGALLYIGQETRLGGASLVGALIALLWVMAGGRARER